MNVFFAVLLDEFSRAYVTEKAIDAHQREVPRPALRAAGECGVGQEMGSFDRPG